MSTHPPLTLADWTGAAWFLDCDIPAIQAVAEVEAPRGGYLADGQVTILFERHWFHRLTKGRYSATHPAISSVEPGGYIGGVSEHRRLREAAALDRDAALQSTSWGRFQIMGFNWKVAGYSGLQDFINGMIRGGEAEHLRAFCGYIRSTPGLAVALREHDFDRVALLYNGKDWRRNNYGPRMQAAWKLFSAERLADREA